MSKRRFFQMHLSTAVALILVASVLVWANMTVQKFEISLDGDLARNYYGWPFEHRYASSLFPPLRFRSDRDLAINGWNVTYALLDALIALAILLAVWQVCEWRIRRSSSKKSP